MSWLADLSALRPIPPWWRGPCFLILGVALGLGLVVAHVSRATSYLSDHPETCVNCHVMRPHYASWRRSSHARVASCNDCHVPHHHVFGAYAFKARDGLYHSSIFTARLEPQVIRLSHGAVPVVEGNCRRCHWKTIEEVVDHPYGEGERLCWDCHREVPHGRARSLSSTPEVMSPELPPLLERSEPEIGGRNPTLEGDLP